MLDCSIHFTFSHEFQHILQLNSSKIAHGFRYSENLDTANFNLTNHGTNILSIFSYNQYLEFCIVSGLHFSSI